MKRTILICICALAMIAGAVQAEAKRPARRTGRTQSSSTNTFSVAGKVYKGTVFITSNNKTESCDCQLIFNGDGKITAAFGYNYYEYGQPRYKWVYMYGYWTQYITYVDIAWTSGANQGETNPLSFSNNRRRLSGPIWFGNNKWLFDVSL